MRSEFQQQVFQGDISHQVQLYRSTVGVHQTSNIQHGESSNIHTGGYVMVMVDWQQ